MLVGLKLSVDTAKTACLTDVYQLLTESLGDCDVDEVVDGVLVVATGQLERAVEVTRLVDELDRQLAEQDEGRVCLCTGPPSPSDAGDQRVGGLLEEQPRSQDRRGLVGEERQQPAGGAARVDAWGHPVDDDARVDDRHQLA